MTRNLFCIISITLFIATTNANLLDTGTDFFYEVLKKPDKICEFVSCHQEIKEENCPDGTIYMKNWGIYGCCDECVQFRDVDESCTGNIDPNYGGPNIRRKNVSEINDHGQTALKADDTIENNNKNNKTKNSELPTLHPVTNTVNSLWCGYFTKCEGSGTPKCEIQDASGENCKSVQNFYDKQVLDPTSGFYKEWRDDYRWRPVCLSNGKYAPKQCKGSNFDDKVCVCVNPKGETIYGKTFKWQGDQYDSMNCLCSRERWERESRGELVTLHCLENGNYDPVQCEKGWCYCVDSETGEAYGTQLPQNVAKYLPCYNGTLYGEQYMRRCGSQLHAHEVIVDTLKNRGIIHTPSIKLNCSYDGAYGPYQQSTGTDTGDYCVDRYNVIRDKPAGGGCKCRRDIFVFTEAGLIHNIQCETSTGVYSPIQIRNGLAFCVDEDGIRQGPLVRSTCVDKLECDFARNCQIGDEDKTFCEDACIGCPDNAYSLNTNFFKPDGPCTS